MQRGEGGSDVAIIGGGIIGTAIAAELAARGATVTLYEAGASVASAASGRNAGLVMEPSDPVVARLFDESLQRYRALAGERLPDGGAFGLPASPAAVLGVATDGDLVRRIARTVRATDVIDGRELRDREPLLAAGLTAVQLATGYPVRPADATHAFAGLAGRLGASIRTGARARPWLVEGVARGVEVDGDRVAAGAVIVAAGPWTPEVVDPTGAWCPIRPMWGMLVELGLPIAPRHVIEELASEDSLLLAGPHPLDADGLPPPFFTMNPGPVRGDGTVAPTSLGNTLAPDEPDPHIMTGRLLEHGRRFIPSLEARHVRGTRVCPRPAAFDGRPLIGRVAWIENLVVAAGNGAFGISTGPATARLAVDALVGGTDASIPSELRASRPGAGTAP